MTIEEENNKLLQEILEQLKELVKLHSPKTVSKEETEEVQENRMLD